MANRRQLIDAVEVTETGIHVVRLKQIFEATSVNEFEKVLAYLLAKEQYRLVVDLTHVEFIASAGWGAFTAEFRNVRKAGGDIRLAGMNPDVQDVFFLLELDSFIKAFETVDEAISSFEEEMRAATTPAARNEETPAEDEAAADEEYVEEYDEAQAEPAGYAIAQVYEPEYRAPLALKPSNAKPQQPEYRPATPSVEEEEGWVIAEEDETEAAETTNSSAHESFADFAPEMTFEEVGETAEAEASALVVFEEEEEEPEARVWNEAPSTPPVVARDADRARANGEEWPEAHAEENLASDDFELQDIHDPWILEEIDTLPEEDELEEADWSASEEDEAPATPVKAAPAGTLAKPAVRAATIPAMPQREILAAEQAARPAVLREEQEPPKRATLADKIKAAHQAQAPKEQSDASLALAEQENLNLVRQIVSAHPEFGPAMIQKFYETAHEPPMQVSRSTVYRWLRLAGLNTREQRLAFAEEASFDNEVSKTSTSA